MAIINEIISPKSNADKVMLVRKTYFSNNDKVNKGNELIDLETSKTAIILDAPIAGFIEYVAQPGDSVNVGEIIIRIHDKPFDINFNSNKKNNIDTIDKIISFAAENYIKKNNIDISRINKHLITLSDVSKDTIDSSENIHAAKLEELKSTIKTTQSPIGLSKQTEIDMLSSVQSGGLVSTISINVEATEIEESDSLFSNTSDTYLPIIIHESSKLLEKYPELNSYFQHGFIYRYDSINIGLALDIDDGLKVYNIRDCNNLCLDEVKNSIAEGVYHYLRKDLTVENITESTFTITDLSQYGVSSFIPLVNNMQSAILGVSAIDKKLGRFSLSLSFDHRVTEGKVASKFLAKLSENIEHRTL